MTCDGAKRLRGESIASPGTVACIARMSLNVNPADCCRTFCHACHSVVSFASTMTFRTPRSSMKAMTCCCAPAPIDSMATTAATPKIIPSIVSSVRSLCRSRLSMLRPTSGSQRACPARNVEHVVEGLARDRNRRGDAGTNGRMSADVERDVELARAGVEDSARGDAAHGAHRAAERRVGLAVHGDFDGLARRYVGTILFLQ